MAISNIIAKGVGFTPGTSEWLLSHGFGNISITLNPLKALTLDIGYPLSQTLSFNGNLLPISVVTDDPEAASPIDKGVAFKVVSSKLTTFAWDDSTSTWVSALNTDDIVPEFKDSLFKIFDDIDNTKELQFQCSGITTGTTRTLTIPDTSATIITDDGTTAFSANQSFGDFNITNVGNISLDSISGDANAITIGDGADTITLNPTTEVTFSDKNITNVGDISLDTISSDAGTSVTVNLGTDAGDDFIVGNNSAFNVGGDTDHVGIGVADDSTATLNVTNSTATDICTILNGASSQTGNLLNFKKNGSFLSAFDADGKLRLNTDTISENAYIYLLDTSMDVKNDGNTSGMFFNIRHNGGGSNKILNGIQGIGKVLINDGVTQTGKIRGGFFSVQNNSTSGTVQTMLGAVFNMSQGSDEDIGNLKGFEILLQGNNNKTGTVTNAIGADLQATVNDMPVTNYSGIKIRSSTKDTGSITTSKLIDLQHETEATTNWQIYSEGGASLLMAGTAAIVPLTIKGAAAQSGSLLNLTDSSDNLYITSGDGLTGSEFRGNDQGVDIDFVWEGDSADDILKADAGLDALIAGRNVVFNPSSTQDITAVGGITVINGVMQIQGSGGAVNITANPQIAAGTSGQIVIFEGESDANTVQINNGDGVHLHGGKAVIGDKDIIGFWYDSNDSEWQELFRNFAIFHRAWSFISPTGGGATFYIGGHYDFGSSANDFNPSITLGTANKSEAAHFILVQAAGGGGGTDTVVRITGTTINDQGTRSTGQTVDITVDDAGAAGTMYETTQKWLGQITIAKLSGPDLLMNYGFAKYWDRNNTKFRILGFESTWLAGANDSNIEMKIYHHKTTGWTYNAGSSPTPPTPVAQLTTDHSTDDQTVNGEHGSWKRDNLNVTIDGAGEEGTIIEITTTSAKTFQTGNFEFIVRPD